MNNEIDKDDTYREKAKEIVYKHLGFWKRFFMSKKRKERFITVFANTMKMAECCKDNENKIDIPETVDTPDKILVHLLKTDMIHLPNNPVMNFSLGEDK